MFQTKRLYYRISKYDPQFRINGIYTKDEWTSVSDVGKNFDGTVLTFDDYIAVENNYLLAVDRIIKKAGVNSIKIKSLEDHRNNCPYKNGRVLRQNEDILSVVRDCLREKYWCKLVSSKFELIFGYDYYLYINSSIDYSQLCEMVFDIGLFVEKEKMIY